VLEGSSEVRATLESINDKNKHVVTAAFQDYAKIRESAPGRVDRTQSNSSDDAIQLVDFLQFVESLARNPPAYPGDIKIRRIQSIGTQEQDDYINQDTSEGSTSFAGNPAKRASHEIHDSENLDMKADKSKAMFRDQADPTWLKESLGLYSTCPQVPPFARAAGSKPPNKWFPPLSVVEETLEDSIGFKSLEDYTEQLRSQLEPITTGVSRTVSSGRRRIVSTAAVHVQFPAIKHKLAQIETFDDRSKAIAALYDYKLGPLSNVAIYDPVKRTFHAQDLDSHQPSSAELEQSGLELVWLPLQPNSSFRAGRSKGCKDSMAEPAIQVQGPLVISEARRRENASIQYLTARNSSHIKFSFSDSGSSDSDAGTEREKSIELISEPIVEAPAVLMSEQPTPDWTASDEEYVIEVDSDTARSYLGSDYSESVHSTPRLESGTLLYPNIPRILLEGEEILCYDDQEISLRGTKTWPQLGKEFKAKHPELFRTSDKAIIEDELATRDASDTDSESSCDFESGAWSNVARNISNSITKFLEINDEPRPSRFVAQSRIGASNATCLSSDDMPEVAHIENVDIDDSKITRLPKDTDPTRTTENRNVNEQSNQESTSSIRCLCGRSQYQAENQNGPWCAENYSLIQSWAEAERAQARLFQADLSNEHLESRLGSCGRSGLGDIRTSPGAIRFGSGVPKQISCLELTQSNAAPVKARTQTDLIASDPFISRAVDLPFTSHGGKILHESNIGKGDMNLDGAKTSLRIEDYCRTSSMGKRYATHDLRRVDRESPPQMKVSNNYVSRIAVPSRSKMAEKSGLLEVVNQVKDLNAVTPQDLNLRLVGKAARQSELAKTSKVSTLVDVFKARGLMSQSLQPMVHITTTSPGLKNQPGRRPTTPSTRIITPSGNMYRPSEIVKHANITDSSQSLGPVKRVPTPASTLSEADTELDDGFGEELVRVEKHL
jgi:hypothetical protein